MANASRVEALRPEDQLARAIRQEFPYIGDEHVLQLAEFFRRYVQGLMDDRLRTSERFKHN